MQVSNFQYKNPHLKEIRYIENEQFNPKIQQVEFENNFNVKISLINANSAEVEFTLILQTLENDNGPFSLQICVAAEFEWNEELQDEDTIKSLLNLNAPALLLGFMRPIVANITNLSQFPVYNIPFIDFTK